MSQMMSNAPVYYALVQVRFNPVSAMAKYVDDIQDELRRDYTIFEPHNETEINFESEADSDTPVQVKNTKSWRITRSNRSAGFILRTDSLTFHTTHYETREEFIPELIRGLKAVHKVVGLDHISRLGLRYLDAVLPAEGEAVSDYIAPELRGLDFHAKPQYSMNETVFETQAGPLVEKGTLIARVYKRNSPLGFPPDMVPNGLMLKPIFNVEKPLEHAVIDTDHFVQGQVEIDFEKIEDQFRDLHSTIKDVFEKTVTEHARAAWA